MSIVRGLNNDLFVIVPFIKIIYKVKKDIDSLTTVLYTMFINKLFRAMEPSSILTKAFCVLE